MNLQTSDEMLPGFAQFWYISSKSAPQLQYNINLGLLKLFHHLSTYIVGSNSKSLLLSTLINGTLWRGEKALAKAFFYRKVGQNCARCLSPTGKNGSTLSSFFKALSIYRAI